MGTITSLRTNQQSGVMLSVIVPFYNEVEVLPRLHERLTSVLATIPETTEIIYVDDGSSDESLALVHTFEAHSSQIMTVSFSRNFGKEAAMSAGLEHANGDAVILIDADLQDPPELIPEMLAKWREGYDVVNMQRSHRHGESWAKKRSAAIYYRLLNRLASSAIPENVGDFRLMSRAVVDQINELPERNRYMKGLFTWPGYNQTTLTFNRDARFCGETKWNYFKLFGLAVDGITSFSIKPLKLASVLGALLLTSAFGLAAVNLWQGIVSGGEVSDTTMLLMVQIGLAGIQLLCVGVLGEYVGRIFIESKHRPLYLVQSVHHKKADASSDAEKQA